MNFLNKAVKVQNMELKNRLVMPPMATSKADEAGKVTPDILKYYDEKSKGGWIGLIIAEHSYVNLEGKAGKGQISISDDSDIPGLQKLVSVVHKNGTKIMAQISHAGGSAPREVTKQTPLSPSSTAIIRGSLAAQKNAPSPLPKEMDCADIKKVIEDFTRAAQRAKAAGFDGVEIHSAHGYLLNQFFSPLINRRTDEYTGASLTGRIRLHLEIIRSIRDAVGADYPMALRLGACDYMDGGTTVTDSVNASIEFEKSGIDLIDISGGLCSYRNPFSNRQGYFDELSMAVKDAVSIPVLLTGGIVDAAAAETLLREGKADLIGVGRAILRDSHWAEKAFSTPPVQFPEP